MTGELSNGMIAPSVHFAWSGVTSSSAIFTGTNHSFTLCSSALAVHNSMLFRVELFVLSMDSACGNCHQNNY